MRAGRVYMLLWCLHRVYETVGGGNMTQEWNLFEQVTITTITLLTALTDSPRLWMTAMVVTMVEVLFKMPFIWDSELWCMQTDLAFLLTLADYRLAATVMRPQLVLFYAAAAFWKLNADFMDPHASCAPIFAMQLLDVLPWDMPPTIARLVVRVSPPLVVGFEAAIAASLAVAPRLGVVLALLLHLGIALVPPPNNVATFSLMCASRLVAFVPDGAKRAADETWPAWAWPPLLALVAVACRLAAHEHFFDVALPLFVAVLPFLLRAVVLEPKTTATTLDSKSSLTFKVGRGCLWALAVIYAFALIPLGLQDQGQPHMYANLRLHGKTNHWLAPTGLLQQRFERDPTSSLQGGVVRVERSESPAFNANNPGEYSHEISPRARAWLRAGGHTGRMWNPMLSAVTASDAPWDPARGQPFTKYTLPAHEFRRLLQVARRNNETFSLRYTQLLGLGNETWRAEARGRTVELQESPEPRRTRRCRVVAPLSLSGNCAPDDLPNLPPLAWWAQKLLLFEAYPILPGDHVLHCFGP